MALNTKISSDIAFKRLAGNKSFTNPGKNVFAEPILSNIQSSADILFGEKLPPNPGSTNSATVFDTASNAAGVGVVQLVEFDLISIEASIYDADATGFGSHPDTGGTEGAFDQVDAGSATTTHSFALHFPSDYTTQAGSNGNGQSQNPKAGTGFFNNNLALTGSLGSVQIVPLLYGNDYAPTVLDAGGNALSIVGSPQDFYLDTFAGVLVRQDGDNSAAGSLNTPPAKVKAYVYIGKMVSESLTSVAEDLSETLTAGNQAENDINLTGSLFVTASLNATDVVDFTGVSSTTVSTFNATGNADIDGNLNVDGNAVIDGTLQVDGNVTLGNETSDTVTIAGDLIVEGETVTVNTANLQVEDQFILLGSSSNAALDGTRDGGIIVSRFNQSPTIPGQLGTALFYDASRQAWGIAGATGSHDDVDNLIGESGNNSPNSQITIGTVEVNPNGNPSEASREKPLHGKDEFGFGQFYVDNAAGPGLGDLYVYLPGDLG